jgi:hypothetical protein
MVNEDPKTRYIFRAKETAIWNIIYYYPHIFLIRDLCVLIVSLVHRACLIGHNEEETSKPLNLYCFPHAHGPNLKLLIQTGYWVH